MYNYLDMQKHFDLAFQPLGKSVIPCGCYVKSQEILKLYPGKSVLAPLVSSQYDVAICNTVANITLRQTYKNPTQQFLQLEYKFPVNPNACIYKFIATFGNKRIDGKIKQKQQAKKEYETAIKEGKKAAYGEIDANSKDILNLKIGNIQPLQSVEIEIVYLQELTLCYNMFYELQILGTITPRYFNHIPNQVIKKSFANNSQKVQGQFYWNFKISIRTKQKIGLLKSKSHELSMISQNTDRTQILLTMTNECVPNKDFNFIYTTDNYELPTSVYGQNDTGSTAIISFIPKFCSLNVDDAYKQSLKQSQYENDMDSACGQYIFLLDRSGSMQGTRIQKATQALILFIKSLPQDTYINVISFGSGSQKLFESSVKYNNQNAEHSINKIKIMKANMGGTQVYQPLKNLLNSKPIKQGYPKQIFLLTDGGVSNTEGVIKMVGNNTKYARVHTIGIGNGCSQQLILGCAKSGKGHHVFIKDDQNPSEKIIQLLTDSLSPVITKLRITYQKQVIESIVPNPDSLPYILKNEIANFCINFKGKLQKPSSIVLQYEDSHNKLPYISVVEIDPKTQNFPSIDKMSRFKMIRMLQDSIKNDSNIEDLMYYVKKIDKKAEVIKQSVDNQILSQYTAFICVQSELVDGKYQQIKNTGQMNIQIENLKPIYQPIQYKKFNMLSSQSVSLPQTSSMYGSSLFAMHDSAPRYKTITSAHSPKLASPQQRNMMMKKCADQQIIQRMQKLEQLEQRSYDLQKSSMSFASKNQSKGGFFDSFKNFFGIGKTEQPQLKVQPQMSKSIPPPPPVTPLNYNLISQTSTNSYKQQNNIQSIPLQMQFDLMDLELQVSDKKQSVPTSSINIGDLVILQDVEGYWKDLNLLLKLYNAQIHQRVLQQTNQIAVLTYLIVKWIQKNHQDAMYKLIIKKGLNYVKKSANLQAIEASYHDITI